MKKTIIIFYTILLSIALTFNLLPQVFNINSKEIQNKNMYQTIRIFNKDKKVKKEPRHRNEIDSLWDTDKEALIKLLEEKGNKKLN